MYVYECVYVCVCMFARRFTDAHKHNASDQSGAAHKSRFFGVSAFINMRKAACIEFGEWWCVCVCVCVCMSGCMYVCMFCLFVWMYVWMCVCMYVCIYACMYVCSTMYVCVCV